MVTTIEQALRPLFLTSFVLGLGIHGSKKLYLNIFCNVILWIAYCCFYYYTITALKVEKYFWTISNIINIEIHFLVSVASIIMTISKHKKLRMFIKRLAAVDDTLEELGIPKVYRKLHIYIKRVLIGLLMCSQLINIMDTIWWLHVSNNYWCIIIPYITNHYQHVNMFVDSVFVIFLWYIGTRFDKLNEHMRLLLLREEYDLKYTWRKRILTSDRYIMCVNDYKRILWSTMHLHLELCQLTRELNKLFEIQITIEMIAYLVVIIRLFRYILLIIITEDKLLSSAFNWIDFHFWISLYIIRLICLNYICESVTIKSKEISIIIHGLTNSFRYADVYNEIYQFTLQIIHHPLKLTGLGLINFGNNFLRKFITTTVTTLIIIIQMSKSQAVLGF